MAKPKYTKAELLALSGDQLVAELKNLSLHDTIQYQLTADDVRPVVAAVVAKEIANDPLGLGYAGKTDQQVIDLFNAPQTRQVSTQRVKSARMAEIQREVIERGGMLDGASFSVDAQGRPSIANVDLTEALRVAIEKEVKLDPDGRGYKGKTKAEILDMLRQATVITETKNEPYISRFNELMIGVPLAPNMMDQNILNEAKIAKGAKRNG